jgi:ribosomal protein L37AE/L43A
LKKTGKEYNLLDLLAIWKQHGLEESEEVKVSEIPNCDFCAQEGKTTPAAYDGKTTQGPWANMCLLHFGQYGVGLGTGKGQKLIKEDAELTCPKCGGKNIQKAEGYKLNKCLSCHTAFDSPEVDEAKNVAQELQKEANDLLDQVDKAKEGSPEQLELKKKWLEKEREVRAAKRRSAVSEKMEFKDEQDVPIVYFSDLTAEEKKDVDWAGEDETFFRYRDSIYGLSEFMRVDKGGEIANAGWDGYLGTDAWGGIFVKVDPSGDTVKVARGYSVDEAKKKSKDDPQADIEKQLQGMGFKKSVAKGLAPSVKSIEKMKVGKVYTIEAVDDPLEPTEDDITTDDHNHWFWYGKLFHIGDTESLKAKLAKESPNFFPSLFFISDHGNAHLINEAIDWKKILASAAIIGALATVPVKGYAETADVSELFGFLGRVVNTAQTMRGGSSSSGALDNVISIVTGATTPSTYGTTGSTTYASNQGYAVWGGTSDSMTCTRKNQADVGKYYKVVNSSDNTEVVVKCTTADSTLGRNVIVSLSRGAFAQISDLNDSSVYVTVTEID